MHDDTRWPDERQPMPVGRDKAKRDAKKRDGRKKVKVVKGGIHQRRKRRMP